MYPRFREKAVVRIVLILVFLGFAQAGMAANLYRWTDESGSVHYSDQPPPPRAKNVKQLRGVGNVIEGQAPYELTRAQARFPVTLFVSSGCGPVCDQAKELLATRGVPFVEKNPEVDAEAAAELKRLIGVLEVPVLVVGGSSPFKGFEATSWGAALDLAGYPKTAVPGRKPVAKETAKETSAPPQQAVPAPPPGPPAGAPAP
jgi:glutaredoxin